MLRDADVVFLFDENMFCLVLNSTFKILLQNEPCIHVYSLTITYALSNSLMPRIAEHQVQLANSLNV